MIFKERETETEREGRENSINIWGVLLLRIKGFYAKMMKMMLGVVALILMKAIMVT